jgi:hypothetical protein
MNYKFIPAVCLLLVLVFKFTSLSVEAKTPKNREYAAAVKKAVIDKEELAYNQLDANGFSLPKIEVFTEALKGFYQLKEKGLIQKDVLTLIDFSMSSNEDRLWVIDLVTHTILYNTLVAHGRNTGNEFANSFSNANSSYKSSLGFYATGEIYFGKHGKSLKLDGLEKGINSNARERAVVMHGAEYVSDSFIKNNKRLGRSLGCPAIPVEFTDEIIQTIKDKSCLFIYFPSDNYKVASKLVS